MPHKTRTIVVAGSNALAELDRLRAAFVSCGEYPFLIGTPEEIDVLTGSEDVAEEDAERTLRIAMDLDVGEWVAERRAEFRQDGGAVGGLLGRWPNAAARRTGPRLRLNREGTAPLPEVCIALARIAEPWNLPAALNYGGWNECPEPEVHCAFLRVWQAEFGAEIAGVSRDTIDCVVRKPAESRRAALALARDQFWYCPDLVDQQYGSIRGLAAALLGASWWSFWWD